MAKIKINIQDKTTEHEIKIRKPYAPKQQVVQSKKVYKRKNRNNSKLD